MGMKPDIPAAFYAYDIREVVDKQLNGESVRLVNSAIGTEALTKERY